jgi:hypothetical protein
VLRLCHRRRFARRFFPRRVSGSPWCSTTR